MPEQHRPPSHLIHHWAAREVSFETCLFEFIDNSYDAGARVIRIDVRTGRDSYLTITDDGIGCADLNRMRVPGERGDHEATVMGRFGIGGTVASIALSGIDGVQEIVSQHRGTQYESRVSWRDVAAKDWEYPDIEQSPSPAGKVGTEIRIIPMVRSARSWKELGGRIAAHFWPALISKPPASIFLRVPGAKEYAQIEAPAFPRTLPGSVDQIVKVGNREARVRCGIVDEGVPNTMMGFSYFVTGRRVIESGTGNGAGDYSIANIHATVELLGKWPLSDHKNRIGNGRALYDAVFAACEPLLKQAQEVGETIELRRFVREVEAIVNGSGATPREKPPTTGEEPDPRPRSGKPNPSGGSGGKRKKPTLRFNWKELGESAGLGIVEGQRREVILNLSEPYVRDLRESRDHERTALVVGVLWNESLKLAPSERDKRQTALPLGDPQTPRELSRSLAELLRSFKAPRRDASSEAAE